MASGDGQNWFCATGKSGLGHLRRLATIARGLGKLDPDSRPSLVTNAAVSGVERQDHEAFAEIALVERSAMAGFLAERQPSAVVVDTAVIEGLERLQCPLALVLRETPADRLSRFQFADGRRWDLLLVPNPVEHWLPDSSVDLARRTEAVGWIYRPTPAVRRPERDQASVLVATGGGGTEATSAALRHSIDAIVKAARDRAAKPFVVRQAVGPRLPASGLLEEADERFDPGGNLNRHFAKADIVLSTAGYNSVLELATLDVPTLLMPITRNIDDQVERARRWGALLGAAFSGDVDAAVGWLAANADRRPRRAPVDLGPSGEDRAAQLIRDLVR